MHNLTAFAASCFAGLWVAPTHTGAGAFRSTPGSGGLGTKAAAIKAITMTPVTINCPGRATKWLSA